MTQPLTHVKNATTRHKQAEQRWHNSIRDAHKLGISLRSIAVAAGVSHEQVRRIINDGKPA